MNLRLLERRLDYLNKRLRHENIHSTDPELAMDEDTHESYLKEKEEIERVLAKAEDFY